MNETNNRWTTEAQIHYPLITETALSPDGTRLIYTVREPLMTEEESRFITHLYLVPTPRGTAEQDDTEAEPSYATSEDALQLTHGPHTNHTVRWSPDGRHIAFLSDRGQGGKINIQAMRADGGEAWRLTSYEETDVDDLAWAPDGRSLAFRMVEPASPEKAAARKAKDDAEVWGEDFEYNHLYRVDFATSDRELPQVTQLTQGRSHVTAVDWFPDGNRLAITHQPTPEAESWVDAVLATVPAAPPDDGRAYGPDDLTQIAAGIAWGTEPKVSPDGAWIACMAEEQPPHWAQANRAVLYPAAGGEPRPLAVTHDEQSWLVGWSGDGRRVYVGEISGLDTHVWALSVTGDEGTPVIAAATYKGAFHTAGNDQIVFAEETFLRPNSVRLWSAADGETRTVVAPAMPDVWPDAPLPEVEVLSWEAPDLRTPDGATIEIEGVLVYPLDDRRGETVPLVVEVHGGPQGVFDRRFLGYPGRYCDVLALASRGVAVLRVNPRGSSGYGRGFRFANYSDWGQGDYRDIMAGVDFLIERGVADPQRLGIMGWSYGGYMTSWAITQTDRFKAACVGAGVTNLMSFTGTADIPGFLPDYLETEFWDDLAVYQRHSPLFNIKDVTTPTLIQHGQADVRVPPGQGRELHSALERQGVPVKLVTYPRQDHRIDEPRLRIDMRRRPVAWFERWMLDGENEG